MGARELHASFDELADVARGKIGPHRYMIGIVGAPGAGKSTLAHFLTKELGSSAALVPMDGFHLANSVLEDLGRRNRKGAPDTFDASGYVSLLRRLREDDSDIVYAPMFDRDIEESIGSALPIDPRVPLIITEGNYLLLDEHPWNVIPELLDEIWYLTPDDALRQERLIDRHIAFGKEPQAAREWALGTDENNARVIQASSPRADVLITITSTAVPE